jgi:hypothetical protein
MSNFVDATKLEALLTMACALCVLSLPSACCGSSPHFYLSIQGRHTDPPTSPGRWFHSLPLLAVCYVCADVALIRTVGCASYYSDFLPS